MQLRGITTSHDETTTPIAELSVSKRPMSRAEILSHGARAGVALTVGGSLLAALTADAAAETLPDADLVYVRVLVGAELLAIDFYTRAAASNQVRGKALGNM